MYLLDLWRKQASSDEWIEAFCKLVKDWKPREWAEEQGQIKAGVGPFLERMQREHRGFTCRQMPHGSAICAVNCSRSRPGSMMTALMPLGSSASF
jgi:hypothetical protein